jgi:recombination protein RecT
MSTQPTTMEATVMGLEQSFNQVNAYKLNFKKEASFALQLLKANDFLRSTAQGHPESLQNAITNIAAIGISLNPATKEAYLVPRNRSICLDISAIGLIKLATDAGSIEWVQAKLVHANDDFEDNGPGDRPIHRFKPFGERGEVVGVYSVAKTHKGDFLTDFMSLKECHDIRDRSEAWKAFVAKKVKSCPWATDEGEMMKKTIIKRASKLWPKSERLDNAVQVLNEHEGIDFEKERRPYMDAISTEAPSDDTFASIRTLLEAKGKDEAGLLKYLAAQSGGEIKPNIEDLNSAEIEYAFRILGGAK